MDRSEATATVAEYLDTSLGGTAVRIFSHTEADEKFSGRGLAATLGNPPLTSTRSTARRIFPVCP
ncbi:putative GNAT family acetyltransferase [Mycobacteroides chelonae]|nr:putative GNAT family acetyltransferase [Mycobacteroides chelonae]